ncbi:TetR/AcrR family transcriptional regulator [Actinomadura craniellae]|uniref:TetR/AcrR family transcriptional regulator n=1 Tax=Actinomadura craniellae TaxID=2231787 RepID=A0A365HB42_9ACTN|nr:TetR/AcrR family transcriptional regulator [Actinomadura craniellae]RAY16301.1 TetR/AcrR family transcriptional regulator [Actinomadura craniellae]
MVQKSQRPGAARERLLAVAVGLFTRHGVNGTSLQMIADELGVTKAAVYYQFQSKDDIVWAVVAPALDRLAHVIEAAERQRRRSERIETVLSGLVDLVVDNRQLTTILQSDPAIIRLTRDQPVLQEFEQRITLLLVGPEPDAEALVNAAMVSGLLIMGTDSRLIGIDNDTLRHHLLGTARRILRLRAPAPVRLENPEQPLRA